jgi:hypothetical protein
MVDAVEQYRQRWACQQVDRKCPALESVVWRRQTASLKRVRAAQLATRAATPAHDDVTLWTVEVAQSVSEQHGVARDASRVADEARVESNDWRI